MNGTKYFLLIGAAALLAVDFSISKIYQKKFGASVSAGLFFNASCGLLTSVIFFFLNGMKVSVSPFSLLCAFAMAFLSLSYSLLGFKILKNGAVAEYSMFLMTGGMTVPFIFGIFFLGESVSPLGIAGIIVIIAAIIMSKNGLGNMASSSALMCAAVFLLNGFVSVISKTHQSSETFETVSAGGFVMLSGFAKFVLCTASIIFFALSEKEKSGIKVYFPSVPLVFLSAFIGGVSYLFQLIGAENLPASVLYPAVTGGSIVLSAVSDTVFFRQKLTKKIILSIAVCFIGTCMFL